MTMTVFLIMSLAATRITRFLIFDDLSEPLRRRRDAWYADKPTSWIRQFVLDLWVCPKCLGYWVSGGVVGLWTLMAGNPWEWTLLLVWWGVAGAQLILSFATELVIDKATGE
jgi:hypothetical protein